MKQVESLPHAACSHKPLESAHKAGVHCWKSLAHLGGAGKDTQGNI